MERLSGLDATFLYLETPSNHMHVCATMIFDPSTVPGGYSFEHVRDVIASRLHLVEQFRRRLAMVPFNINHPVWFEDPDFDLDYHVRRIAVPAPGGPEELAELAGEIASRPLDRSKPLWELWVVEGLEHGHVGIVAKMHHSTVDGVSGANLMVHLFDMEPDPQTAKPDHDWKPERKPTAPELIAFAVQSRAKRPALLAKVLPDTARSVVNVVRGRRGEAAGGPAPLTAPRTSLNQAISPHRRVAFTDVSLADVKAIKNDLGVKVNDVVLAICAGALRRYLDARGEHLDRPLIATVPVSVRTDDDDGPGANKVSAMFTSLATDIDDPIERLKVIGEMSVKAKAEHHAVGANTLQNWAEFAAPTTFALAARLYSGMKLADRHRPIHNLVISNVPGPPFPLYLAGMKIVALYPLGPIFDGAALNVTVISYMESMDFGFMADRESVPGVWDLANAVHDSLAELKKAAERAGAGSAS